MNLKYKYLATNPLENCVEVRFYTDIITEESMVVNRHPDGSIQRCRSDVNIMLPYPAPTGADLEKYILSFAPTVWFENMERHIAGTVDPIFSEVETAVGQVFAPGDLPPLGESVPVPATTLDAAKAAKKKEVAAWRYRAEVGGVTVNGVRVLTDRESQAQLTGALFSLQANLLPSINWKSANGAFVSLSLPETQAIAQAVAQHVQSSFDAEMAYRAQIDACTTVAEVQAITLP